MGAVMDSSKRNITCYLRDAVVSQKSQQIEITEESVKIQFSMLEMGRIPPNDCQHLFEKKDKQVPSDIEDVDADVEKGKKAQNIKVIVVAQVINVKADRGIKHESDIADLTGTFFLPASLNDKGILMPEAADIPWIPRNYLSPIMDNALIVGKVQDVDTYIASQTKELSDIKNTGSWEKYISYAKGFWKAVNDTELCDSSIYNYVQGKYPIFLDYFAYIVPDNTISSTHHIKKLYEYSLTEEEPFNELYQTIIDMVPKKERPLAGNLLPQMLNHAGQMNGSYPLSPSQREAINHFDITIDGDVLAVNGPPGTGKTTLLQSIVADMMVKRALSKADAPVIVATSTNNQAVTNIIESFADTSAGKHPNKLDKHWVNNKKSFATYFPSKSKLKEAVGKGYQVTDTGMGHIVSQWENDENKANSFKNVLEHCRNLFGVDNLSLEQCTDKLHNMLSDFDLRRREMLKLAESIPFEIRVQPNDIQKSIRNIEHELFACHQKETKYKERLDAWKNCWRKLILYRVLSFIPHIKKTLNLKMSNFRSLDEEGLPEVSSFALCDVEAYYDDKMKENRVRHKGFKTAKKLLEASLFFEDVDIHVFASTKETISLSLGSLNEIFDANIRFYQFWLSVHYYECRWLAGEHKVEEKEMFKSTYPVMVAKYKRLCMLSPCLVMTFYMLPANFSRYKNKYLYNFIDLLIVDEAGQVSPEIGAASFLLAKKALVVGDVYQIEPVWGVSRELDMSLAIDRGVVKAGAFYLLERNGLNTSGSSLMKIASNACAFSKFGKKGLLLTEHRRCYDELINYCNDLVYDGKLEPLRGPSASDHSYPFPGQKTLEHIQVLTAKSEKHKTSRYNLSEAQKIREWLNENFDAIKRAYHEEPTDRLVGIITPFKAQADYIRKELQGFAQDIAVGTVHTFQGGERRVVLFSTVYGADEGCAFLDFKPNLMNVAMSRAKDRFIVVGDINCLSSSKHKPSGLLKTYFRY
jgi:energy-coupling factor transporter ATP-binding protein EcfA2